MIVSGFIFLSLLNFLIRSLFDSFNLLVAALFLVFVLVLKGRLIKAINIIGVFKIQYIFITAGLLSLLSIFLFNPILYDDPLNLTNQAIFDLKRGLIDIGDPYSKRNLFFLIPIYAVFGTSPLIIQIINCIIYLLSGFFFFRILCIHFSESKIVQNIGTVLFFSIPYLYLSLNIPHYDLAGTFYLMISLYFFSRILIGIDRRKIYEITILSIFLGLSFLILFYTRGLTAPMIISLTLFGLLLSIQPSVRLRNKLKTILFSIALPLVVFAGTDKLIKNSRFIDNQESDRSLAQMVFSYNDTRFDGTTEHHDKKWVYFPLLPQNLRTGYALKKVNSEIDFNWQWYLFRLSSKSHELFSIGGINDWILHDSPISKQSGVFIKIWELILQYSIVIFGCVGLLRLCSSEWHNNLFVLFSMLFIFTCSFFVLFSEVSNRYSLIFLYGLIILAALGTDHLLSNPASNISAIKTQFTILSYTGITILVCFFGYRGLVARNYSFEQLKERSSIKKIGQVNLTAFQKQLNKNDSDVILPYKKHYKKLTFFLRKVKKGSGNIEFLMKDGLKSNLIVVSEDTFSDLISDPDQGVCFLELDVTDFSGSEIKLDFCQTTTHDLVIEYVNFYKDKVGSVAF
jgi:hypothetical protein